jgi:hypothetical protein
MSEQQSAKPLSKRAQIRAVLQEYHGTQVSDPNAKQIAKYNAHVLCANEEYKGWLDLVGMYAGYYIIRTSDPVYPFIATRLYGIFTLPNYREIVPPTNGFWVQHEEDGTFYQRGKHSHIRWAKTQEGCLAAIIDQMAYNAAGRSANKGIWQRRLPTELQIQPHARDRWFSATSVELDDILEF